MKQRILISVLSAALFGSVALGAAPRKAPPKKPVVAPVTAATAAAAPAAATDEHAKEVEAAKKKIWCV